MIETSDARFDILVENPNEGAAPYAANFAAGLGGVYIGGRVNDRRLENRPDGQLELIKPITEGSLSGIRLGVRPAGLDDFALT